MKLFKRILLAIVVVFTMLIIIGPFLVKGYVNKNGKELTGRKISLAGLYHNPFTGYTRLRGFEMYEQDNTDTFVSFDTLIINLDLYRLLKKTFTISEVRLVNPFVQVIQDGERFNFSDIPEHFENTEPEPEPEDTSSMVIEINNISLIAGASDLLLDQPFHIEDVNLHIPGLYFDNRKTDADLSFDFQAGGGLRTNTTYISETGQFHVSIDLNRLDLVRGKILQLYSNISGQNGFLSADIDITGNLETLSETEVQGAIVLADYEIFDQNNVAFLSGDEVRVEIAPTKPLLQEINLDLIEVSAPVILVEMYADSTSNLSRLAKETPKTEENTEEDEDSSAEVQEADPSSNSPAQVAIREFKIVGGETSIKDHKPYDLFEYRFYDINVNSANIRTDCTMIINATAKAPDGGSLEALFEGHLLDDANQSYSVTMNISDLTAFSPYTVTLFDFPIEEGQLGVTNTSHVNNGYMEGLFVLESSGITLGNRAETNSQYDIPLKTGLWVMEDKNGNIHMEMPVEGAVTNIVALILDTFFDQIMQIVNTPFKILGRAAGFDGDMTTMEFNPVHNEITPEIGIKLDKLVEIMETKPDLIVTLVQTFDSEEASKQLAVYQVKSDYYRRIHKTREVQDYFSIDAVKSDSRDFREYVSKQAKLDINSEESLIEGCLKIKRRRLEKETKELADSWNSLVEQYLIDNGVSPERFSFQQQESEKGAFEYELTSDMAEEKELKKAVKEVR